MFFTFFKKSFLRKKIIIISSAIVFVFLVVGSLFLMQKKSEQNIPVNVVKKNVAVLDIPQISIKNFAFTPDHLTVKKGELITWVNEDTAPHQLAGTGFGSEVLEKGKTFIFVFNKAGSIDYHCTLHPSMKGTITVK